jgi:hypothetical protein
MDLKIVSGVFVTREHGSGRVVLDFGSNAIVGGDLGASDLRHEQKIAPSGMGDSYFDGTPCVTVALHQIKTETIDRDDFGGRPPRYHYDLFRIDWNADGARLTVDWSAGGGSRVEEISYLAIGEVSSPPEGPI